MGTLTARYFNTPGSPGVVVIRRDADAYRWDFTNNLFSAAPALDYRAPTADANYPGMFLFQLVQTWSGLYQLFWYPTSAKTGKPLVLSIHLTSGAQDDIYAPIAESLRLSLIEAPLDANITQVNGVQVAGDGSATPWGPA